MGVDASKVVNHDVVADRDQCRWPDKWAVDHNVAADLRAQQSVVTAHESSAADHEGERKQQCVFENAYETHDLLSVGNNLEKRTRDSARIAGY